MSRYIDAEYCEDFFDRWESRVKNAEPVTIDVVQNTRMLLREAPSIDIVFCKECDNFIPHTHGCKRSPSVEPWGEYDSFCDVPMAEAVEVMRMYKNGELAHLKGRKPQTDCPWK